MSKELTETLETSTLEILVASDYPKRIIPLIEQAQNEVLISVFLWNFYFNDPGCQVQKLNQALIRAVQRGVKVKALVSNESSLKKMVEMGVVVKGSQFANKLHNKIMIIDQKYCIIGSHNLTKNALERNYEISVLFELSGVDARIYQFVKTMVDYHA